MADMGVTETTAGSFDYVSAMVQLELINKAILYPTISSYSEQVPKGADSVKFPRFDSFSAQDKTENSATTFQALTMAADQLELSKHKHIPVRLEDIAGLQTVPDVEGAIVERMASAMVAQWEDDIYAQLILASASNPDHRVEYASAATLAEADILGAIELLDIQNVPASDRFLAVHPTQKRDLLEIDNFVQADRYGSSQPIQNGELGMAYGLKVVMSTAVTQDTSCIYHRSHVAFAAQMNMKFEKQRAPLDYLADDFSLSTIYGVKVLDAGKRGVKLENAS